MSQTVSKTFQIIEFLSNFTKSQPLKDIAAVCNLPTTTAHRLLNNLCSLGYAVHEESKGYKLSYRLFEISSHCITNSSLISIATPFLDEMSEELGESVHLVVRDGNDIIYVYKVTRSVGSVQMVSRIGMRLPMYRCAVGKAILATLSDEEIRRVFETTKIVATTKNTITSFDNLMKQIYQVRTLGYAIDDEENEEGIKCVATMIRGNGDAIGYAISVSSLKFRMTDQRIDEIVKCLLATKQKIEEQLQYTIIT